MNLKQAKQREQELSKAFQEFFDNNEMIPSLEIQKKGIALGQALEQIREKIKGLEAKNES